LEEFSGLFGISADCEVVRKAELWLVYSVVVVVVVVVCVWFGKVRRRDGGVKYRDDGFGLLCGEEWDIGMGELHFASGSFQSGRGW
jgi:hypothetical protein